LREISVVSIGSFPSTRIRAPDIPERLSWVSNFISGAGLSETGLSISSSKGKGAVVSIDIL